MMDNKLATKVLQNFRKTKHTHGVMLVGKPGEGKDSLVEKIFPKSEVVKKTGYTTGRGLFDTLANNPDKVIVLSDTYGWESEEGMSLLKAALDSKNKRVITRDTKDALEPVVFRGKIIFIANSLKGTHHLDALKSRCEYIHLQMTEKEFIKLASKIISEEFSNNKYSTHLIEFMIANNSMDLRKVAPYYEKLLECKEENKKLKPKGFEKKWKDYLGSLMAENNGENEITYLTQLQNKKLSATESKALFTQKFPCSDRTFYRRWSEAKMVCLSN
jgi:hypothetical protein